MLRFKHLLLCLLVLFLFGSKAYSFNSSKDLKRTGINKCHVIKNLQKAIGYHDNGQFSGLKKKRKARGIKVLIPQIPGSERAQIRNYNIVKPVCLNNALSSFLHSSR